MVRRERGSGVRPEGAERPPRHPEHGEGAQQPGMVGRADPRSNGRIDFRKPGMECRRAMGFELGLERRKQYRWSRGRVRKAARQGKKI